MKRTSLYTAALMLALAGCSSDSSPSSEPLSTTSTPAAAPRALSALQQAKVDRAAKVAAEIQANPDSSDDALARNSMTQQQFEDLLYEIAADPAMSAAYNAKTR